MCSDKGRSQTGSLGNIVGAISAADSLNHERVVFQKINGDWKIARYCFSTSNPPHR
jgi:hypothetical protein